MSEQENQGNVAESKKTEETKPEGDAIEGEFKLTVKKLEMPVRPRGVLAE